MKSNGSAYVVAVIVALTAYFTYQWWFNPNRMVQRRLGQVAAILSAPPSETPVERLARVARLRDYLSPTLRVRLASTGGEIASREAAVGALAAWLPPPGGVEVNFVDVQVRVDDSATARAFLTVEVTTRRPEDPQPTIDSHEAKVALALENGAWVITAAEPNDLQRP